MLANIKSQIPNSKKINPKYYRWDLIPIAIGIVFWNFYSV